MQQTSNLTRISKFAGWLVWHGVSGVSPLLFHTLGRWGRRWSQGDEANKISRIRFDAAEVSSDAVRRLDEGGVTFLASLARSVLISSADCSDFSNDHSACGEKLNCSRKKTPSFQAWYQI
jgi:hypothetical protein